MAKSLQDFLQIISEKGVRKNHQFQLDISSGYSDVDKVLEDFTVFATVAEIPSRTQEMVELPYQGYNLSVAGAFQMSNEHTFTVRDTATGDIRRAFLKWQSYMTNPAISQGSMLQGDKRIPANSYVRMHLLGDDMETIVETIKLIGCSVQEVGVISMSNESVEIATTDIIIRSQYWELENIKGEFQDLF